jgi:hypothetical protein
MRRAGPGPGAEALLRPLAPDPDCLLLLMISSRAMSKAVDMFLEREEKKTLGGTERGI